MKIEDFKSHVAMLLHDLPIGTTADLTDFAVAYWGGRQIVYAFLSEDRGGEIDEEFDLDDYHWAEFEDKFSAWAAEPKFSERREVLEWIKDAPPFEAG
jgi:hypothetical protein